jgi:hypothetical protein
MPNKLKITMKKKFGFLIKKEFLVRTITCPHPSVKVHETCNVSLVAKVTGVNVFS